MYSHHTTLRIKTYVYSLDTDLTVRICDSALSRDLFPDDYHCLGDNENRPLKWMALENLQKKPYSTASDVWGLGVLLWELGIHAETKKNINRTNVWQ